LPGQGYHETTGDIGAHALDIHAATGDHETMHLTVETELVKRNSADNQARFYRLAIWPDLFGGYSLAREYGRIGQPGKLRLDPYPEESQAIGALHALMWRKTRRGYNPITGRNA
jgi:predicted DNA-binding WGR domain protein